MRETIHMNSVACSLHETCAETGTHLGPSYFLQTLVISTKPSIYSGPVDKSTNRCRSDSILQTGSHRRRERNSPRSRLLKDRWAEQPGEEKEDKKSRDAALEQAGRRTVGRL